MADATTNTAETPDPQAALAVLDAMHKRKKTAGEVVFDRVVYTGIGFGVNEASSLWITDQFMYGNNLFRNVPALKPAGKWFSQEGFTAISKSLAGKFSCTQQKAANSLLMFTLLSGGTLLILPMKWLENNKADLVKKTNHALDQMGSRNLSPDEVAARDAEVEQHIAHAPKQSWPTMLLGRVVAAGSSWATGTFLIGPERNNKIMGFSERVLTDAAKATNRATGGSMTGMINSDAWRRYTRLAGVETYSCLESSIVLEMMSKLFAARHHAKHTAKLRQDAADAAALAAGTDDGQTASDSGGVGKYSDTILAQRAQPAQALAQV